jgi:hypothetical protein
MHFTVGMGLGAVEEVNLGCRERGIRADAHTLPRSHGAAITSPPEAWVSPCLAAKAPRHDVLDTGAIMGISIGADMMGDATGLFWRAVDCDGVR